MPPEKAKITTCWPPEFSRVRYEDMHAGLWRHLDDEVDVRQGVLLVLMFFAAADSFARMVPEAPLSTYLIAVTWIPGGVGSRVIPSGSEAERRDAHTLSLTLLVRWSRRVFELPVYPANHIWHAAGQVLCELLEPAAKTEGDASRFSESGSRNDSTELN